MYGAGLSADPHDSEYLFQAGGQKNPATDPALREKRDPEVAERYKGAANTLHRDRKALLLLFPFDQIVGHSKRESSASFEMKHLLPAMFRVLVS